ncbi:hypothetical protein C2845_PM07G24070 [Panicum miliaceum]|uniref:KIB1-4 beta-propeller domain-containing protein n=1 Tax=Panicum miliaceum TaxID=4540 RepID=A0A3L6SKT5_PANMI|nr:hypothetical protein C2845_PM07G24070 [Panicum miliaceum]
MSSRLPLLVFHHRSVHNADADDEMLVFSLSQQKPAREPGARPPRRGERHLLGHAAGLDAPRQGARRVVPGLPVNPRTGDRLPLPDTWEDDDDCEIPQSCKCFLSHKDPTRPGCIVALFRRAAPVVWYCPTVAAGDGGSWSWRRYAYDIGDYPLPPAYRLPTKKIISVIASFQEKPYFIDSTREVCAIDFSTTRPTLQCFDVHGLAVRFPHGMCSGREWLVESQDQLFLVRVCFIDFDPDNIGAIDVYRMDFSSSTRVRWLRVHDIGDAVLLLEDANMAASCPASALGLDANRIYFMRNLVEDDADLCIFDLESNTLEIIRVHRHDGLLLCRIFVAS